MKVAAAGPASDPYVGLSSERVSVQLKTLESIRPGSLLGTCTAAFFYLACSAAIVGWSLPNGTTARDATKLATGMADAAIPNAVAVGLPTAHMTGKARSKLNCVECGVIESMRKVDTREEIVGWCGMGDAIGTALPHDLLADGKKFDPAPLADIVADIVAGDRGTRRVRVTTQHQIVVRFRDGSRHVFTEETPRAVRVGDRIQVIAGVVLPKG